jgi:hypothetical protein
MLPLIFSVQHHLLVSVEHIATLPAQLRVRPLKPEPQCPCRQDTRSRERCVAAHSDDVLWPVALGVQIWCVDETSHRADVDNGQRNSLLFGCLAKCTGDPSENDGVDGVDTGGEEKAGYISRSNVERCRTDEETNDGETHHAGDMPCSIVELSRRDTDEDADSTSDKRRGCGKDKSDGCAESERLDNGWEELESSVDLSCEEA